MTGDDSRTDFAARVAHEIPALLRFAIRLTGQTAAAEEVVQEALYRAARSRSAFRGDASHRTWLLRIVIHAFRDSLTAARREANLAVSPELVDLRQPPPDRATLEVELRERIATHVSSLPPRQREVLTLAVYEELPLPEIAELLGISVANVHVNLHHARSRLKHLLADYLAEK
ncbi:MAG: RNA polymerase sigma factor [Planctomycetaceae bacterium]|nr:RNA polymerase sigma factor [Planctomycetaceae bacterium]